MGTRVCGLAEELGDNEVSEVLVPSRISETDASSISVKSTVLWLRYFQHLSVKE